MTRVNLLAPGCGGNQGDSKRKDRAVRFCQQSMRTADITAEIGRISKKCSETKNVLEK